LDIGVKPISEAVCQGLIAQEFSKLYWYRLYNSSRVYLEAPLVSITNPELLISMDRSGREEIGCWGVWLQGYKSAW